MKIALVCTEKLPVPPISGGAIQLYIEGILPELSKYHDITVFSVKHPSLPDCEEVNRVKYIRVAGDNKTSYINNLKQKLTGDFDLIHVFNRPRFVLSLAKDLPNTKFSLSLHNEMFHVDKIPMVKAIECINRVEFITTVSKFIAEEVTKLYPIAAKKIYPVYSGVDVDIYKPVSTIEGAEIKETLKKKYGLEDKKVILFVGRLSVKKGVDKLFDAMKKIMDLRTDVALVVIGSKWYGSNTTDKFTELIDNLSKSLKGPIVFTGFLPPSEIPMHYNIGDIFVCPSQWNEPLARVHYEAMAAGLPIITTNRGGNSEVIIGYNNGVVLEDFNNTDALALMITELLDNTSKASEYGQTGRKLAEEKYNWKRVATDLQKLFSEVEIKLNEGVEKNNLIESVLQPCEEKHKKFDDVIETKIEVKKETEKKFESKIEIKEDMIQDLNDIKKEPEKKAARKNPYLTSMEEYYLKLFEDYLD